MRVLVRVGRPGRRGVEAVPLSHGCIVCDRPLDGDLRGIFVPPHQDVLLWGDCDLFTYRVCRACELLHSGPDQLMEAVEAAIARRLVVALGEAVA